MRHSLLLIVILLCNACTNVPDSSQPSLTLPTAVTQSEPTVSPSQVPTLAPLVSTVAPATPSARATAAVPLPATPTPPGPAHPAWIAIRQVGDPVEGIATINLVNADTGKVLPHVCPSMEASPLGWSYDGSWLACVTDWQALTITLVNAVDPSQTLQWELPRTGEWRPTFLAWSPVEQSLAVSIGSSIYLVVPDAATPPRLLKACQGYQCSAIAWSPDGQRIATNDIHGLSVLDLAGGSEITIADEGIYLSGNTRDTRDIDAALESVAYAPDGRQIAYTAQGGIYVVAAAGGDGRRLIAPAYRGADLAWSQDGHSIEFIGPDKQLVNVAADGSGSNYGEIAAQVPTLSSIPFRCTATMRVTGDAPVLGFPGPEKPPSGPLYNLFLGFTRSTAVVQLTQAGIYGPLLLRKDEKAPTISPRLVGAWAPGPVGTPTLALREPPLRGCAVLELQTRLVARNVPLVAIDGIYGPATEAAVQAFQQANNLTVDGIVGEETWAALGGWGWDH